jgi:hypothetical protein
MRANSVLLLIALVGSSGCVSGYAGSHYGYDRPVYGSAYDHGDYRHVYNTGLGVYTVVGYPSVYFHDGWYWRYSGSHWQRCARPYGGTWSHIAPHYVPRKLHAHYDRGHYRADARRDQRREPKTIRRNHPNERKQVRGDDRYHGKQVRGDDRYQGKQVRGDHRNQAKQVRPERQDPGRQPIRAHRGEPRHDRNERAAAARSRDDHSDARGQQRHDRSELKRAGRASPQELRREPRKPHERARRERATARHEQRSEEHGQRQRAESQPQERHGRLAGRTDWRGNR